MHTFSTPDGDIEVRSNACILALGGGSWARLGSDGAWLPLLMSHGIHCAPLVASNCGFDVAWSAHLQEKFAGVPLKSVELTVISDNRCVFRRRGEAMITRHGVEGSLIYAASRLIQREISEHGQVTMYWDLLPDHPTEVLVAKLSSPRGKESLSNFLRKRIGLTGIKLALLRECAAPAMNSAEQLAQAIKALPMVITAARPIDEAISTAGGVVLSELDEQLMLRRFEGVFCAGEMLDWDAPTGGYLLTACFASGRRAALGVASRLRNQPD